MSDLEPVRSTADPLPDRLRQYLSDIARRELDSLRLALESRLQALEVALAHPEGPGAGASIESLVIDLARVTTAEAEASAAQRVFEAQLKAQEHAAGAASETTRALEAERATAASLGAELAQARAAFDKEIAHERAATKQARDKLSVAQRELTEARRSLESRSAAIDAARSAATAAQAAAAATMTSLEARAVEAESRRRDADARARDLEARLQSSEARADEAARARDEAVRARDEAARGRDEAVKARDEAVRAREHLDQRLAVASDYEQQLASVDQQIRALELQLFQRERPVEDRDEDLSSMLEQRASPQPVRAASRYSFAARIAIEFDGEAGILVDLSTGGAQVLSSRALEQDREGVLVVRSAEVPLTCGARIVWTRLDPNSHGRPLRYRAGVRFAPVDAAAVEAFIIRYSGS
ncbi:MAG TPA: PilZ domain-containing protein [Vicinamibacterales bacterium]|jgi:chromosome segregation ATPase|nr:PilZ domain-containing protein [Vicinamibacterales bacterium]